MHYEKLDIDEKPYCKIVTDEGPELLILLPLSLSLSIFEDGTGHFTQISKKEALRLSNGDMAILFGLFAQLYRERAEEERKNVVGLRP